MIPTYLLSNDQPFRVDYLVIAGGGRGQGNIYPSGGSGGGGGAGGYLCSVPGEQSGGPSTRLETIEFIGGQTLTVTVGAGGSAKGGDSVFGSVVAEGGGFGENANAPSQDGGSGGGGPMYAAQPAGSGTTNQGNDGGTGSSGENFPANGHAGGGGGAGEVGEADGQSQGGDGLSSSITGTAIFRAGGGGGSNPSNTSVGGVGGLGGGGRGRGGDLRFSANPPATAGEANTGGGGGGGGGNGGSGVVILRYPSLARIIDYIDPGLTYSYSDDGTWKRYIFTNGSGSIRF